eukprot:TRINITY_DN503_c0_g1_i1.p2 TRINITY_DN503_c0_g1~~TRINITY_DN503_c0_g1_i1.p2  ORF type:complete len:236 (+),score=92.26 TRINITY_DN503_c0_g1_i1:149-856(+)
MESSSSGMDYRKAYFEEKKRRQQLEQQNIFLEKSFEEKMGTRLLQYEEDILTYFQSTFEESQLKELLWMEKESFYKAQLEDKAKIGTEEVENVVDQFNSIVQSALVDIHGGRERFQGTFSEVGQIQGESQKILLQRCRELKETHQSWKQLLEMMKRRDSEKRAEIQQLKLKIREMEEEHKKRVEAYEETIDNMVDDLMEDIQSMMGEDEDVEGEEDDDAYAVDELDPSEGEGDGR